ncbi:MAG: hypothetical protein HY028_11575 [Gammaproteobacteria bacterium]|nr:hypothetical protein [Gammaproteobacteria bacterium]
MGLKTGRGGADIRALLKKSFKFTAPLTAITAAVVGVILNLALFFAYHVFWPQGFGASFAWFSALLSALAFIALVHYRAGVVPVIIACGTLGLVHSLLSV